MSEEHIERKLQSVDFGTKHYWLFSNLPLLVYPKYKKYNEQMRKK